MAQVKLCCEVCPISNVHLCDKCFGCAPPLGLAGQKRAGTAAPAAAAAPAPFRFADHPLRSMLDAGIPCCLNADDPATFGAPSAHGLVREFEVCREQMGLSDAQLAECARNSFVYSLCPDDVRQKALADIDAWLGLRDA